MREVRNRGSTDRRHHRRERRHRPRHCRPVRRAGANVAMLARGEAGLAAAAKDVESAGGTALAMPTDVADARQVEAAADRVEAELGPIDVWVNVAFTSVFAPFHSISAAEFRRVTEVTYLGYVHGTMAALSRMRRGAAGTIVQVGSALGYRSIPLQSAYCGAKHASTASPSRCAPSCCTSTATSASPSSRCLRSTPRSSRGCSRGYPVSRSRCRPSTSPSSPPGPSSTRPTTPSASSTGWRRARSPRCWPRSSPPRCSTATWPAPATTASRPTSPIPQDRPYNLWEPCDRRDDYGAHGAFDAQSHAHDPQQWCSRHPRLTASGALAATALLAAVARRRPADG